MKQQETTPKGVNVTFRPQSDNVSLYVTATDATGLYWDLRFQGANGADGPYESLRTTRNWVALPLRKWIEFAIKVLGMETVNELFPSSWIEVEPGRAGVRCKIASRWREDSTRKRMQDSWVSRGSKKVRFLENTTRSQETFPHAEATPPWFIKPDRGGDLKEDSEIRLQVTNGGQGVSLYTLVHLAVFILHDEWLKDHGFLDDYLPWLRSPHEDDWTRAKEVASKPKEGAGPTVGDRLKASGSRLPTVTARPNSEPRRVDPAPAPVASVAPRGGEPPGQEIDPKLRNLISFLRSLVALGDVPMPRELEERYGAGAAWKMIGSLVPVALDQLRSCGMPVESVQAFQDLVAVRRTLDADRAKLEEAQAELAGREEALQSRLDSIEGTVEAQEREAAERVRALFDELLEDVKGQVGAIPVAQPSAVDLTEEERRRIRKEVEAEVLEMAAEDTARLQKEMDQQRATLEEDHRSKIAALEAEKNRLQRLADELKKREARLVSSRASELDE